MAVLEQVDIRVGTIEAADDVTGSDRLLLLRVNFGDRVRQIVSGIKQERENPGKWWGGKRCS